MTDVERREHTHRGRVHWTKKRKGKGFVFIFAANQCEGISPIFEFQMQQEDLIRVQRKLVEICGH